MEHNELILLEKAIPILFEELESELQTRTGYYEAEIRAVLNNLKYSQATLTVSDSKVIRVCLNELLHGIDVRTHLFFSEIEVLRKIYEQLK